MRYQIVGAGLFGSVIAERVANVLNQPVEIFEKRNHIGGNCYSFIDYDTGIECHKYGTHIFHTELPQVWNYINQFTGFNTYRHKVVAKHKDKFYRMPVNLGTINAIYDKALTPAGAKLFITQEIAKENIATPQNLEEKAISLVGRRIYEALIKDYTQKQWNRDPCNLPENIITRIPVRYNFNDEYFNDFWQGLPLDGYGVLFERLLDNPLITVHLETEYKMPAGGIPHNTMIIYTGMPDQLFDYKYGKLDWRSLHFEWETIFCQDFQGCGQVNYCDSKPQFTRIHEYKHYHPERKDSFDLGKTVTCREYPQDYGIDIEPCYPVNDRHNNELYSLYEAEAQKMSGLILGGRLGSYKYWNMDYTIANALDIFEKKIAKNLAKSIY